MTTATYLVGDVFERLAEIPDGSVDLVMTSPPFYRLRSYLPDDHPDKGKEIGSEPTPAAFLDTMLAITAEWGRVLAPHGSICVELGDTYRSSGGTTDNRTESLGGNDLVARSARLRDGDDLPPEKSLLFIPSLYAGSLAYGRNLLTGTESPAGRWRVRNLVAWVRPNPPVGALGDKYRPATSYLTIATRARDRYFDLDAVRTPHHHASEQRAASTAPRRMTSRSAACPDNGENPDGAAPTLNPAGAPPLDWWNHTDLLIDDEIAQRAGKPNGSGGQGGSGVSSVDGGSRMGQRLATGTTNVTVGATGSHIRRRLEQAGYLGGPTDDVWDIAPSGYPGAHYAVYPPELCTRPILTMTPRRVCTTCGQPSRRIVGSAALMGRQPEIAAHIRERRTAAGLTMKQVNDWFPGNSNWCGHWEDTMSQPLLPTPEQWAILKDKLDLSDEFDAIIEPRSTVQYMDGGRSLGPDERRRKFDRGGVPSEGSDIKAERRAPDRWSDCGHNTWRPGHVLDPFAGTGTTLAVATGHSRQATGIDIDPRNAQLAQQRVGMFLTIDWGTKEATA